MPRKVFTDEELDALPIQSAIARKFIAVTDPETGETHMEPQPMKYMVSTAEPFMWIDADGQAWMLGLNEDGYFKHRG